jgi:hypothetical protein
LREEGKKIFYKYYTPKIITFGLIHHNRECLKEIIKKKKRKSECLKEGEQYKHLWTLRVVVEYGKIINQDPNQACHILLKKIEDDIEESKNIFTEDAIEGYTDNDLAWILFVDGCYLLHFMKMY